MAISVPVTFVTTAGDTMPALALVEINLAEGGVRIHSFTDEAGEALALPPGCGFVIDIEDLRAAAAGLGRSTS